MKLAIIEDGIVDHFITALVNLPDGASAVVIDGLNVNENDLYDGKLGGQLAFSPNPKAADLAAAAAKVQAIKQQLDSVATVADLKSIVAQVNADVNP